MIRQKLWIGLAALGFVAPWVPHFFGMSCWIYLPAHAPALLGGLFLGIPGALAAILGTLVGEVSSDGPSGLSLVKISLEIATYGLVAGYFGDGTRDWKKALTALVSAMLAGRAVYALLSVILQGKALDASMLHSLFVTPWPGIILQLALLPVLSVHLSRRFFLVSKL